MVYVQLALFILNWGWGGGYDFSKEKVCCLTTIMLSWCCSDLNNSFTNSVKNLCIFILDT